MPGLQVEGGVVAWNLDGASIRSMDPRPQQEDWPQHPPFDTPVFETMFANLQARSDESLARHGYRREGREYRIESPNRDRLAIFCHGGFGLTRIAHLLDLPVPLVWGAFLLAPSSVTTILLDKRNSHTAAPRCLGLSETSHLYEAGLPIQPAGIVANFD